MRVTRARALAAPPQEVWDLVSDPWHLPRWWPNTERVEGVGEDGWTSVLSSPRGGRTVRADYTVERSEPPRLRRWRQDVEGGPFERIFRAWAAEIEVEPSGSGSRVRLTFEVRGRGWARFGGFMIRSAMKRLSGEALDGLEEALTP